MCVFSSYKQYMLWKIKINKHKKNIRTCNLTIQIALLIFFCRSFRTFLCLYTSSKIFFFLIFIYLFMAVLGLRFWARAFSSCGKWGPLFIAVRGPLIIAGSLVAKHRLQTRRLSSCGSWA